MVSAAFPSDLQLRIPLFYAILHKAIVCRFVGSRSFEDLVRSAGMELPYEDGCVEKTALAVEQWLTENTR